MIVYEGISKSGEKVVGKFAGSKEELIEYLKSEDILLVSVKYEKEKGKKGKLTLDSIYLDLEQLYYLLSSGLKIDLAISTIIKNLRNEANIRFWEEVLKKLKEGKQLSIALKETSMEKKISFPEYYINVLSVGEEVGDLLSSLKTILEDIEFKRSLKKEIKSALSYPLFLIFMSIITVFLIAGFILPKFSEIFSQNELEKLPVISRFVIDTGRFINENTDVIVLSVILLLAGVIFLLRLDSVKKAFFTVLYRIPYINTLLLKLELSNMFFSLSTMLKGGIHINRAISQTQKIVKHPNLKNVLSETQEELKKGRQISKVFSKYPFIPYEVSVLISVGEQSAKLEEIFDRLGKKYINEFKNDISKILTILEPAVIVLVGLFIGFIVIAILLAVLSVSDVI